MAPAWFVAIPLVVSLGAAAAQQADVRNARIDTRDTSIERAVTSLGSPDPVWVAWRVPMVSGLRDLCGNWSDGITTIRGAVLEGGLQPQAPAAGAPVERVANLEAGTTLLVWVRVVEGAVERLRVVSDDCPVDAGGRQVIWLSSVTAADSVGFLERLLAPPALPSDTRRRLATTALMAVAHHDDALADAVLDRFLTPTADAPLRSAAAAWTARARGARGLSRLTDIVRSETDVELRRAAAGAIAQSRQPETLATLWRLAEADEDEQIRAGALAGYAELAGESDVARVVTRLTSETSETVRQRAVRGLARRPAPSAVALLLSLARTSTDRTVRTEAVRALSRTNHPQALAYLAEILK
ncbi:MAG: HEAT repeat domain-containing protein [Acidobacteria bacterium]|nr:HEAT repeat domain-containing protein [Acidobacteriota bacterium]